MALSDRAIAEIIYSANRGVRHVLGESMPPDFPSPEEYDIQSILNGVRAYKENPNITPEQSHVSWYEMRLKDGWSYGPFKSMENKTHPCMVPYQQLPPQQQVKDRLFLAIVGALVR